MKKVIAISFLFILCLLTLTSCGKEKKSDFDLQVSLTYDIHTEIQKEYLANDYKLISLYANGQKELSRPESIKITWDEMDTLEYNFYLSETKNFNDKYLETVTINEIDLINLKINTKYYCYVECIVNKKIKKSDIETFSIKTNAPRNLKVNGVTNVRDLGGYEISSNKYTKQGLIYRSARFNENESSELLITEAGINVMLNTLKVKTELDVRKTANNENGGITTSPLGETVNYISIPMATGGNYLTINKNVLKDVFAVFGNKDNYPIVIHCSIGTDRTGVICFLINALLGVSEEDLYRDYLFSNFGYIEGSRPFSTIDKYLDAIDRSQGNNLKEKTYNYLVSVGVNSSDLDSIINIMI